MNAQLNFETTQAMPTRERLARMAEGVQTWIDNKVADHNVKRSADRRIGYSVRGWEVICQ